MIGILFALCADYEKIVADVFEAHGLDRPPIVRLVDDDHPQIGRPGNYDAIAAAVLLRDGREYILINRDSTLKDCRSDIEHEVAHLIAWRRHGPCIRAHGREFKKVCRAIATGNKRATCH